MTSASQEDPHDVLDGFFDDFDHLAAAFGSPKRKRSGTQKLGYAVGLILGIGIIIVCLGTLAWIGAFVFNHLLAQVG
jgi:hypothetical protein